MEPPSRFCGFPQGSNQEEFHSGKLQRAFHRALRNAGPSWQAQFPSHLESRGHWTAVMLQTFGKYVWRISSGGGLFFASKATAACYCIPIPILAGGSTVNELHAIVLVLTME